MFLWIIYFQEKPRQIYDKKHRELHKTTPRGERLTTVASMDHQNEVNNNDLVIEVKGIKDLLNEILITSKHKKKIITVHDLSDESTSVSSNNIIDNFTD